MSGQPGFAALFSNLIQAHGGQELSEQKVRSNHSWGFATGV